MPEGLAINRQWVLVLENGTVVIDWSEGVFQDLHGGDFLTGVSLVGSHAILDDELDWLKRVGNIAGYDERQVFVLNLPEYPKKTLE